MKERYKKQYEQQCERFVELQKKFGIELTPEKQAEFYKTIRTLFYPEPKRSSDESR